MKISASLIQTLREATGAKMLDCKEALVSVEGDIEAAKDWLRAKGIHNAAKKSDRTAGEGVISAMTQDGYGVIIEMNSETDFVARNQDFQDLVQEVLSTAVSHKVDALEPLLSTVFGKDTLKERILEIAGKVGENLILRRISFLSVDPGVVVSYIHSPSGTGRVGVLLALNSGADPKELYALGKKIAMHIAASNPVYIRSSEVPVEVIARERAVLSEQAASSGRPEAVIEKMVEGRLQKFFSEIALEEQDFICEPGKKVKEILQDEEKKLGTSIQVTGMVRYALGGAS